MELDDLLSDINLATQQAYERWQKSREGITGIPKPFKVDVTETVFEPEKFRRDEEFQTRSSAGAPESVPDDDDGPQMGACCVDGECELLSEEDCDEAGGDWFENEPCEEDTCAGGDGSCTDEDVEFTSIDEGTKHNPGHTIYESADFGADPPYNSIPGFNDYVLATKERFYCTRLFDLSVNFDDESVVVNNIYNKILGVWTEDDSWFSWTDDMVGDALAAAGLEPPLHETFRVCIIVVFVKTDYLIQENGPEPPEHTDHDGTYPCRQWRSGCCGGNSYNQPDDVNVRANVTAVALR